MNVHKGGRGHRSKSEHDWWKAVWKNRPVILERPFDADSFNVDEFPQFFTLKNRLAWTEYLKIDDNFCNLSVCTEFLAGLLPLGPGPYSYQGYVRGKSVTLNPVTLSRVMGVPPLEEGQYQLPYEDIPTSPTPGELATLLSGRAMSWPVNREGGLSMFERKDLHKDFYVLWWLVCNSLMPTSQHSKINLTHARVMEAIVERRPFCLVRFFIQQIASVYESNNYKDGIKMGVLITKLCFAADVEFKVDDVRSQQLSAIDKRSLNRALGQYKNRPQDAPGIGVAAEGIGPDGLPVQHEGEAAEGEQQQAGPSQGRRQKRKGAAGPVPFDMEALVNKMDEMHASNQSHYTSISENHQRFRDQYGQDMGQLHAAYGVMNERYEAMYTRQGLIEDRMGQLQEELGTVRQDVTQGFAAMEEHMQELLSRYPPPSPDF